MKVRQGFVSNSSSSSFIIPEESYKNIFDLAKKMIPVREWSGDKKLIEKIEKYEKEGMNPNTPICFNSCNYETFIVKLYKYYVISTCNNHPWENFLDMGMGYIPSELKKYGDFEDLENIYYNKEFFYVEYDVYATDNSDKYCYCLDHWAPTPKPRGENFYICLECYNKIKNLKRIKNVHNRKK